MMLRYCSAMGELSFGVADVNNTLTGNSGSRLSLSATNKRREYQFGIDNDHQERGGRR